MNPQLRLYRQQQVQYEVEQSSPLKLVLLLYDKMISLLQQSLAHLEEGDLPKKGEALLKAGDILSELQAVLNTEAGGDIAIKLDGLYTYMIQQITVANYENDPQPISTVLKIAEELRDGWRELEQTVNAGEVLAASEAQGA